MKLRTQMLLAASLTLIVPLVGWQSVKQLYIALQKTRIDEQTLKVANMRLALSESPDVTRWLAPAQAAGSEHDWYAEATRYPVFLDGYDDDWKTLIAPWYRYTSATGTAVERVDIDPIVASDDNELISVPAVVDSQLSFRIATRGKQLFLFIKVLDDSLIYHQIPFLQPEAGEGEWPDRWQQLTNGDAVEIALEGSDGGTEHGLFRAVAPGAVVAISGSDRESIPAGEPLRQWRGFWSRTSDGFQLEVSLPLPPNGARVGIALVDIDKRDGLRDQWLGNAAPALMADRQAQFLAARLFFPGDVVRERLDTWSSEGVRARLFDARGLLVADVNRLYTSTDDDESDAVAGTFNGVLDALLLRVFSLMVADELPLLPERRVPSTTLNLGDARRAALQGDAPLTTRYVTSENDRVLGTLAPLGQNPVRAYLLLEANEEHAQAYAGSQLARLFSLLLLTSLLVGCGLLVFAMVLSSRIRRLSRDAQQAVSADGRVTGLAGSDAQDEIGDLSRRLSTLLTRSAQYTNYLEALAGRLSHELRTPLSVVRTSLENLDVDTLDKQSQQLIERAEGGAVQLGRIIKALVDSTRLEQAVQSATIESVDLGAWLTDKAPIYQQLYPDIRVLINPIPSPSPVVNVSPELLHQAMDKLMDNAVSFATDHTVLLQLSTDTTQATEHAILAVSNHGRQIDEAQWAQLFDPLVSHRDTIPEELHLGIGLYMVRLIAEAANGWVFARNQAGGVVFGLSLPLT